MKLFRYLLLVSAFFSISLKAADIQSNTAVTEVNAVLDSLEKNYPALMNKLSTDKNAREEFLKRFINSFNAGIEYVPADGEFKVPEPVPDGKVEIFNIINIASNRVSYIRIDSFTPGTVEGLGNDSAMVAGFSKKSCGIVIDLRTSRSGGDISALKAARFFSSPDKIPELLEIKDVKRLFKLPVVILVSGKTQNASELFAALMEKAGTAIIMGHPTSGGIFPVKPIEISTGGRLLIPDISPAFAGIPANPVFPSIMENPFPQIDFKKLSSELGSESSDRALSRAVELLISISVIRDKMKED